MRRILALLLAMLALCCAARAEEFYSEMPYDLRVTQRTLREEPRKNVVTQRAYPRTNNASVDEEIRALVDAMYADAQDALPQNPSSTARLDVGAVISRTGTSWMSFLTLSEIAYKQELLSVDFDARVYDMQTGERLALTDVFAPDSEAWELLSLGVREQLLAAFPGEEADAEALDALCSVDSLKQAPFTLGGARLVLTFRADAVYPGKNTLLHAVFYYPDIRALMTPRAFEQTDNSRFRMVALTYDDGGASGKTRQVLSTLREYGAQATFFIVGRTIRNSHDTLGRQQNAGYSIQSHSYTHRYAYEITADVIFEEKQQVAQELSAVTGLVPTLMRAPGGIESIYVKNAYGYPLIHWSVASGDSGSNDAERVANRVIRNVGDGDVVLMHDTNSLCAKYSKSILEYLNKHGFLCVTVEELYADAGVPLEANRIYFSSTDIRDE